MTHAYLKYVPAFPKPSQIKTAKPAILRMSDGREICLTSGKRNSRAGREEYHRRIRQMKARQNGICCLYGHAPDCPGTLRIGEATFEHENGRAAGKRDDRITLPDGTWINGAAHLHCNLWKGSRRIDYNAKRNAEVNRERTAST